MTDPKLPTTLLNIPGNFLSRLLELEDRVTALETAETPPIEEIIDGRLTIADMILSPALDVTVADATSSDYTGAFMAGGGIEFDGSMYVIGNVVGGVLKTGFTDTGTLYAIDAEIEGTIIIGAGSEAGGWLIDATSIYSLASDIGIQMDSSVPIIRIGDTAGVHIQLDGANQRIRSSNYVSGASGSNWDTATGDAEFNNIVARGMIKTAVFEKDVISSVGGTLLILDSDVLDVDMTAADNSTLTIQGNTTFAVGDILRMKDGTDDEWMEVTSIASAPTYVVDRDRAGSYSANNNPEWKKGQAVVNYGQSGDGGIALESGAVPKMKIFNHAGSPWTTITDNIVFQEDKGILMAREFPSQVHLEWQADDTNEVVAKLLGMYVNGVASGIYTIGQEKDSSHYGVSGLAIQAYDQDLGEYSMLLQVDSKETGRAFVVRVIDEVEHRWFPGGSIFQNTTVVGNVGTGEDQLYANTLVANTFGADGDTVLVEYELDLAAHATETRRVKVYFAGSLVYDSTALVTASSTSIVIRVTLVRASSSIVRCSVSVVSNNSAWVKVQYNTLSSLTLGDPQGIALSGECSAAVDNRIVARYGVGLFFPGYIS